MAADEVLLAGAEAGRASLRFYEWSEPTLSLGYFQPVSKRDSDQRLIRLPLVRRPTGGDALVHHFELTYALALPADGEWYGETPWSLRMHHIIAAALRGLGVQSEPCNQCLPTPFTGVLCFKHQAPGDVLIGPSKIVGSAQRRRRGAVLQHGAILLTVSPYTPSLPGIRELTNLSLAAPIVREALIAEFTRATGWSLAPEDWSEQEVRQIKDLTATRYTQDSWNRKR
jgi:lipoate-protein ligase A